MQWLPPTLQKLLWCIINLFEARFNYIIIWIHISASHFYIVICIEFAFEWIYLGVLRHALGVNDIPVIKVDCKYHFPYVTCGIIKLSRPHYHGLDRPGPSREEQHNRKTHHCVRIFLCLSSSLRINIHVTSLFYFISLCFISVGPGIFPCRHLVRLM